MRKLSTGLDSTLGNWLQLCTIFFGEDSPATQLIQDKINESTNGEAEEVIADEGQLIQVLGHLHMSSIEKDGN